MVTFAEGEKYTGTLTQSSRALDDCGDNGTGIGWRGGNDPKDLSRGGLLLQRFGERAITLPEVTHESDFSLPQRHIFSVRGRISVLKASKLFL
jgi:hypothetical protein